MVSCTPEARHVDDPTHHSKLKEGDRFTARVAINSEDLFQEQLRSASIEKISEVKSLRVLVFDENQNFLYSEDVKTLGEVTDPSGQDFLPDHKQDGINEIRYFEVSLVKSVKKRYVHFVANHDWTGFTQDYFAKGTAAGEFMTHKSLVDRIADLQGNNPQELSLWSMYEAEGLDENTFKDKVVKLLRTYAKITIKVGDNVNPSGGAERFELTGYAFCNIPDRGSIAPYATSLYSYEFPFHPVVATQPVDMALMYKHEEMATNPSQLPFVSVADATKETEPYYLFEKDNTKDSNKTFLIIKGKRYNSKAKPSPLNGEERYYKIDLVTRKQIDPDDPTNKAINTYFPILRNKYYTVNINGIKSDGYKTVKEAIESAAGNNVFADTKLQEFGNVSDGTLTLSVDPIQLIIVQPGKYEFNVNYSGGNEHVKYYPSWDTKQDKTHIGYTETGYYYTKGEDSFLGGLRLMIKDGKPAGFEVDVDAIPTDATKEYFVEVAALRQHNGNAVDGTSGATSPLTRKVRIVLHSPFPFNEKLNGTGNTRTLSFKVYPEQEFPKSVFPFDVFIEAPGMTPINEGGKRNVTIENIYDEKRKTYVSYYKYTVQEEDRGTVNLKFKINNPTAGTGDVTLTSKFYRQGFIRNDKAVIMKNRLRLSSNHPNGNSTTSKALQNNATIMFELAGQRLTAEELLQSYGVEFKPVSNSEGVFEFNMPETFVTKYGSQNLTIYTSTAKDPASGSVKYDFRVTKSVNDWTVNKTSYSGSVPNPVSANLELYHVYMTGRIYYQKKEDASASFTSEKYKPTGQYSFKASRAGRWYNEVDLTNEFKISGSVDSEGSPSSDTYYHYNFTLDVTDADKLKAFTERGVYTLSYSSLTNGEDKKNTLVDLESNPTFKINVGSFK